MDRINAVRTAAGAKSLRLSGPLCSVAQARAEEMAAGREAPGPAAEEDARRASKAGYETRLISEVTAEADGDVDTVVAAWQVEAGSASRELAGVEYREIGIGVSRKNDVPLYVLIFALSWEDFFRERTDALSDPEHMRRQMLSRVNRERVRRGFAPLRRHSRLDEAAQAHADDMLARRYYSHDTPEGKTTLDRLQAKGYRAKYAAENIARG